MSPEEVIEFCLEPDVYSQICRSAVHYALLSLPFTTNRMQINDLQQRVVNIAKGKIAEGMVREFCRRYAPSADFETTATPYYQVDKRDFLFRCLEWDIKTNFYSIENPSSEQVMDFPALVPNRSD
ncbi:MAG: hypothetical protein RMI89_03525 [Gloeomargarita sp. SKYBB_i_bin120]|nr:hypothetical protein [Gloeomargarita sp. SKYG98]MCS7292029.1 hypothetical protein [Gloeomargarita sp. SKYB120]MDW8177589.1 hypothetical protein [Gloeomargarita sp. SKYBB_i_bin120]